MVAALNGNTDTVKILLEHGADVNTKDNSGQLFYNICILLTFLLLYILYGT